MPRGDRVHRSPGLGRVERKRGSFFVFAPGTRGERGERIGDIFKSRSKAEAALAKWLRQHARELGPKRAILACGCGPRGGCSLGDLLFRFERFIALERHLEESYDQTFLSHNPRKARAAGEAQGRP